MFTNLSHGFKSQENRKNLIFLVFHVFLDFLHIYGQKCSKIGVNQASKAAPKSTTPNSKNFEKSEKHFFDTESTWK